MHVFPVVALRLLWWHGPCLRGAGAWAQSKQEAHLDPLVPVLSYDQNGPREQAVSAELTQSWSSESQNLLIFPSRPASRTALSLKLLPQRP